MRLRRLGFCALAAALPGQALAQSEAARIEALEQRVQQLSAEVLQLRGSLPIQTGSPPRPAGARLTLANGRPSFTSEGDETTFSIRVLTQLDYAYYMQGSAAGALPAAYGPDLSSGGNFRRVNIGFQGTLLRDWNYNLSVGFGGNGIEQGGRLQSAYLEYAGWAPLYLRAGAFGPSSNTDSATPNTDTLLLERVAVGQLHHSLAGGDGRTAIAAIYADGRLFGSFALTGGRANDGPEFDEQLGVMGRLAVLAASNDHLKLVMGMNGTHIFQLPNNLPNGAASGSTVPGAPFASDIRLQSVPELSVDSNSVRLVNTGDLPASHVTAFGVDGALQVDDLFISGGYLSFGVDRAPMALNVFTAPATSTVEIFQPGNNRFTGWYVAGSWVLTGEQRGYNAMNASFTAPRPAQALGSGGFGALEWAGRYSVLDLNDRVSDATSFITGWSGADRTYTFPNTVRGGRQTIIGSALHWYPNNALRFTLQYQWIDIDRLQAPAPVTTSGLGTPALPAFDVGQRLQTVAVRAQFSL